MKHLIQLSKISVELPVSDKIHIIKKMLILFIKRGRTTTTKYAVLKKGKCESYKCIKSLKCKYFNEVKTNVTQRT